MAIPQEEEMLRQDRNALRNMEEWIWKGKCQVIKIQSLPKPSLKKDKNEQIFDMC